MDKKMKHQLKLALLLLLVTLVAVPATVSSYRKAPTYEITVTTTRNRSSASQDTLLAVPQEKEDFAKAVEEDPKEGQTPSQETSVGPDAKTPNDSGQSQEVSK